MPDESTKVRYLAVLLPTLATSTVSALVAVVAVPVILPTRFASILDTNKVLLLGTYLMPSPLVSTSSL